MEGEDIGEMPAPQAETRRPLLTMDFERQFQTTGVLRGTANFPVDQQ
jgi:hypothetical protein